MIPKIIHYVWLGGNELPPIAKKCIESWKKFCPDFEIMRWDESNVDLSKYEFVQQAYDAKKFAFASDVIRFEKLYEYGGIYLDIDVELLKTLDEFLNLNCFTGFECSNAINPGIIFGTEKHNQDLKNILEIYSNRKFIENGKMDLTTVCDIVTDYYKKFGLNINNTTQTLPNIKIFASEYFSPINYYTNKKKLTKNTHSIHWYSASWYSPKQKFKSGIKKFLNIISFGLFGKVFYGRKAHE